MSSIGKMDRRITIRQRAAGLDAFGQPSGAWEDVATVWASYRTKAGGEGQEPSQRVARQTVIFRIRYRAGIRPEMQVAWDGETFDVVDVAEFDRRRWLDLVCTANNPVSGS